MRETELNGVIAVWIWSTDNLPGECLIITRQHAHVLGRVLETV